MTDTATRRPIQISTESPSGPYLTVSVEVLEKVRKFLVDNNVPHWVEHHAISVNGRPAENRCDQSGPEGRLGPSAGSS